MRCGGVFTLPPPRLDLHHRPVAVTQLEDVQVVLGIDVLLHSAVLARNGNNAGKDLIVQKMCLKGDQTLPGPSTRSPPPP